MLKRMTL